MHKQRRKRSKIWTTSREDFTNLISVSTTFADVLRALGLVMTGSGYRAVKDRCIVEGIDCSHIPVGIGSNRGRKFFREKTALDDILIVDSEYNRGHLKNRLIAEGLLEKVCQECKMEAKWNGRSLVLVLDHINGIRNDNRLDNLRLLCPNCNSQTSTFSGRNK